MKITKQLLLVTVAILFNFKESEGANILGIFGLPVKSHQSFFRPIWRELALRGHNVTVMATVPLNDPNIPNLREIDWSFTFALAEEHQIFQQAQQNKNDRSVWKKVLDGLQNITEEELKHPALQSLIEDPVVHFDVVLVEYVPPAFFYLSERFNCPLIQMSSMPVYLPTLSAIGNPTHPLISPDINLPFGKKLSFVQRFVSTVYTLWFNRAAHNIFYPLQNELVEKHLAKGNTTDLATLERRKTSIVITNVVPEINNVRPTVPALVEVHGIHLTDPKPLPKDIQTFLDGSPNGVIYFSLGTSVRTDSTSRERFKVFAELFSELPYKVVWKLDVDDLPLDSNKILARKWFSSQQDILRHPNVKLFVMQGGLQSMEEAIAYQVPMLGMPFFGDQRSNVKKMVDSGMGLELDFETATKEEIRKAVLEIMENPRYVERVREVERVAYDRPFKPMEETIWWIEYVIRHKGAPHLRSPYLDMSWNEYFLIDVFCVCFLIILFLLYAIVKLLRLAFVVIAKFNQQLKKKQD